MKTFGEIIADELTNCNDWMEISKSPLTEDFIREFQNKLDWIYICKYQKLSEDLIREFRFKVYWKHILMYQNLSDEFMIEFEDIFDGVSIN